MSWLFDHSRLQDHYLALDRAAFNQSDNYSSRAIKRDRGQWAQTATGRIFYPLDPRPEDICIDDIAAGLSRQCRYAGQLRDDIEHYSIAEHCVCLARYFHARGEIDNARWALMHDAAEFCGELIRPIKCHVPEYRALEKAIHDAIFRRFRLPLLEPDAVKDADNRILLDERDAVMSAPPAPWDVDGMEPLGAIIVCYPPRMARFAFLHWFGVLFPEEARMGWPGARAKQVKLRFT